MRYSPILYDFKRGFIRTSVLTILVLFILSGIGLAYMVSMTLRTALIGIGDFAIVAILDNTTRSLRLEGHMYDSMLRDLSGRFEYDIYCHLLRSPDPRAVNRSLAITISKGQFHFNGRFVFENTSIPKVPSNHWCYIYYAIDTGFGYLSGNYAMEYVKRDDGTVFYLTYSRGSSGVLWDENRQAVGRVQISSLSNKTDLILIGTIIAPLRPNMKFDLYIREQSSQEPVTTNMADILEIAENPDKYGYIWAAQIEQGIFILKTTLRNENTVALHHLIIGNSATGERYFGVLSSLLETVATRDPRSEAVTRVLTGQAGLGLFATFFPVMMIYLAYVYIAKPRSQGALEFIIARPITRLELYMTRLIAGVFVALISTAVFYLAMVMTMQLMLNTTLDLYIHMVIYCGLALSLIAFYSLCYFLSTVVSGTRYLIFALFLYMFFTIVLNIVVIFIARFTYGQQYYGPELYREILRVQFISKYFTPLGIQDFTQFYAQRYYDINIYGPALGVIESVVSPWMIAFSTTAWIFVPAITGWLLFRKANLSG
ncbi:MAG: ABC transporter permease subunit [Desulfurococcaceae archaeon]